MKKEAEAWRYEQQELTDCAAYFHTAPACLPNDTTTDDRKDINEIAETANTRASVLGFRIGMRPEVIGARMKAALDKLEKGRCADFSATSIERRATRCSLLINEPGTAFQEYINK